MVLAVRGVVETPLFSTIAALRRVEARYGDDAVHGLARDLTVSDPTGWLPATEITSGRNLPDLLEAAGRRWRAQPPAAAALAWKSYTYWLALPALAGYAESRRVPLPDASAVLVRFSDHQPFISMALNRPVIALLSDDPLAIAGAPHIKVCANDAALRSELRHSLLNEHLDPLLDAIQRRVRLGRRGLLGSLASGVAHALVRTAGSVPGPIADTIDEVLGALGIADLVDVQPDPVTGIPYVKRRTCCLAFTLPEPKICTGCCIR